MKIITTVLHFGFRPTKPHQRAIVPRGQIEEVLGGLGRRMVPDRFPGCSGRNRL